jgi:hypothetical protein
MGSVQQNLLGIGLEPADQRLELAPSRPLRLTCPTNLARACCGELRTGIACRPARYLVTIARGGAVMDWWQMRTRSSRLGDRCRAGCAAVALIACSVLVAALLRCPREPATAGIHGRPDCGGRPDPPSTGVRPVDGGGTALGRAEHHACADRDGVRRARHVGEHRPLLRGTDAGQRGRGQAFGATHALVHRRRQPRTADTAHDDPRVRRAVPTGRRGRTGRRRPVHGGAAASGPGQSGR